MCKTTSPDWSVSPTVRFEIDRDVYVPFTHVQCVQLVLVSYPCDEVFFAVAHPEFTPFWFALGEHLVFDPMNMADTEQGVTVVFDQGVWPQQCMVLASFFRVFRVCLPGLCVGCRSFWFTPAGIGSCWNGS